MWSYNQELKEWGGVNKLQMGNRLRRLKYDVRIRDNPTGTVDSINLGTGSAWTPRGIRRQRDKGKQPVQKQNVAHLETN